MVSNVRQAVIMVGGKGTRLYPLTDTVPKPALPVLDKPCLKYLISSFAAAGIEQVFLACGYKADVLEKAIGDGSDMGVKIEYSVEDTPLGTGGAMKKLEDRLDDVFAAANGDTFIDMDISGEIEEHLRTDAKVTISLTHVKNPCEYGIVRIDGTGRITEFKDKPKPEEVFSDLINSGIYVVNKEVLEYVPDNEFMDFSKELVPFIVGKGMRVQGYECRGIWKGVGRPSDLISTNLLMADRCRQKYGGERVKDSNISGPFFMGDSSNVLDSDVSSTVVLRDCTISDSTISGSLIMDGCKVDGATIRNCILGAGCTVGNGTRLTDSVIRDGTIIGNSKIIDGRMGS